MHMLDRIGRRGAVLLLIGSVFVAHGVAVMTSPTPPFAGWQPFGAVAIEPWGALFALLGGFAALVGLAPRSRLDVAGYTALMIAPALWALLHTWSWLAALAGDPTGNPRGWAGAVVWSASIALILIVSGWPEPPRQDGR